MNRPEAKVWLLITAAPPNMVAKCQVRVMGHLTSAVKLSIGSTTGCTITEKAPTRALNVKALVGAFNQEKALVGAFSMIVQLHRLIDLRHC